MDRNLETITSLEQQQDRFLSGRPWWQEILIVFISILPQVVYGNEYFLLLLPLVLIYFDFALWKGTLVHPKKRLFSPEAKRYLWLVLGFVLLAGVNKIVNGDIFCLKDYYAPFLLLPVLLFCSRYFYTVRTFKVFIAFVIIQTVLGLIQYISNDRSLILPLSDDTLITSKSLLYDSRVFGLTVNSSIYSLHILIAFLFLPSALYKRLHYWIIFFVLLLGMLLSFGRAVVLMVVFFFAATLLQLIWKHRKELKRMFRFSRFQDTAISAFIVILLFLTPWMRDNMSRGGASEHIEYNNEPYSWDTIPLSCAEQHAFPLKESTELDTTTVLSKNFLRLTEKINTSGRKLIWLNYVNHLSQYPWTGNGSNKLMFRIVHPKTKKVVLVHAHNSYFMIFGTHGFILGTLFIGLLVVWWKRKNFILLLTLCCYSFLQYGIFWGLSLIDIVFMSALLFPFNFIDFGYKKQDSGS